MTGKGSERRKLGPLSCYKDQLPAGSLFRGCCSGGCRRAGEMESLVKLRVVPWALSLLGTHTCGVSSVKGPRPADEKQSASELDLVLQRHQGLQEKLAEEMLGLARSLKTNTLAAQSVIKKDNQTLSHSLKMADQNLEKLKLESERLEQHAQKSVNWLLWAMLIIVCFVFISMILFIRIMPRLK